MNGSGLVFIACLLGCLSTTETVFTTSTQDLEIIVGQSDNFTINLTGSLEVPERVDLVYKHTDILNVAPTTILVNSSSGVTSWLVLVHGISPGHDTIHLNVTPPIKNFEEAFIRVTIEKSHELTLTSVIVGWIYFAAWSVSFYPQVYENWKRKSVVGLNFDFLTLNIIGFALYSIFNCGLYWIPEVEEEYFLRHPGGLNPVQLNDIVFALHATLVTLFTIGQCLCYERGAQVVSLTAKIIVGIFSLVIIVTIILSSVNVMDWLDFLYACSYVKLTITLIKYIPQAVMNYKRKSTIGWSIGNVVLDFTGGILSMLQMIINADNYNDWASIFGDPTKFGLGLFSVLFDIFFLIQHYILYRGARYEYLEGRVIGVDTPEGLQDDIGDQPTSDTTE